MQATKAFDRIFFRLTHPMAEVTATKGVNKGKKVKVAKQERFEDFIQAEAAYNSAPKGAKLVEIHEQVEIKQVLPVTATSVRRPQPEAVERFERYEGGYPVREDPRSFRRAQ